MIYIKHIAPNYHGQVSRRIGKLHSLIHGRVHSYVRHQPPLHPYDVVDTRFDVRLCIWNIMKESYQLCIFFSEQVSESEYPT